jgi:hypothetical protein
MAKHDPMRERIEAFNHARGGGVRVNKAGRGYTLVSERTGLPLAKLKPSGDSDKVQVLWWNGQRWGASGPFGIATMTLDRALDYIASDPTFWVNA